jgi:hypothetical protein
VYSEFKSSTDNAGDDDGGIDIVVAAAVGNADGPEDAAVPFVGCDDNGVRRRRMFVASLNARSDAMSSSTFDDDWNAWWRKGDEE